MCLILIRDPGTPVNFENIEAACENNPHGWGYVIPDRGKLEIRRNYNKDGTNPDHVMRVIEDNADKQIFLHLRWCTHGDRSKANVHPFPALQKRKDGMQVWVMHNGTVQGYTDKGHMSDTYHFTNKVISPLLRRFMSYNGKKRLLTDPMLPPIIEKFAGGWSKFVLVDEYGNYSIIGSGVEHSPGLWLSNEYSFKPKYRKPETKTYQYGQGFGNHFSQQDVEDEYSEFWPTNRNHLESTPPLVTATTLPASSVEVTEPLKALAEDLKQITDNSKPQPVVKDPQLLDKGPVNLESCETFCDLLGLDDISEVFTLSEEDIFELVCEYPEHVTLLIRDLIIELDNAK